MSIIGPLSPNTPTIISTTRSSITLWMIAAKPYNLNGAIRSYHVEYHVTGWTKNKTHLIVVPTCALSLEKIVTNLTEKTTTPFVYVYFRGILSWIIFSFDVIMKFNPCSPEGFSQTYFPKGGGVVATPLWIINTEGHITLNLLPMYRYGHPLSIDTKISTNQ